MKKGEPELSLSIRSAVSREPGFIRRHLHPSRYGRDTKSAEQTTSSMSPMPDRLLSGKLHTVFWWKHPGWKDQYVVTTPARQAATDAAATLVTGTVLTGAVLVGFNFPTNPSEASAEVTGLVAGAVASIYLHRKSSRNVI